MYIIKGQKLNNNRKRGSGLNHIGNLIMAKIKLLRELWGDGVKKGPNS